MIVKNSEGDVAGSTCDVKDPSFRDLFEVGVDFAWVQVTWYYLEMVPNSFTKWFFQYLWMPIDMASFMMSYLLATEWKTFFKSRIILDWRGTVFIP